MVEQASYTRPVLGSNPSTRTLNFVFAKKFCDNIVKIKATPYGVAKHIESMTANNCEKYSYQQEADQEPFVIGW